MIEKNHTLEEWNYNFQYQIKNGELWDFLKQDVEEGAVELDEDKIYWEIGDRIYETPYPSTITIVVERPDGTTYQQQVKVKNSIQDTLKETKKYLGKKYWVVDWF